MINIEQTIYSGLRQTADTYPDREALIIGEQRLIYRDLIRTIDSMAAGLQQLGLRPGDRIALMMGNCPEFACALLAPMAIGVIPLAISPMLREHEVQHILRDSGAAALITLREMQGFNYLQMISQIRPALPELRHVIVQDRQAGDAGLSLADLLVTDPVTLHPVSVSMDDLAFLSYTSGTTGEPKGVMLNQRAFAFRGVSAFEIMEWGPDSVFFSPFPICSPTGVGPVVGSFLIGSKVVLLNGFNPRLALATIQKERASLVAAVPAMLHAMLMMPDFTQYDLSSVRAIFVGGAPVPPPLIGQLKARVGCGVVNIYGSAEAGMATITRPDDPPEAQTTTIGRPWPGFEMRIVDDARGQVAIGQVGELAFRSLGIMQGYYKRPDRTAQVLDDDGWYYTCDLAYLDPDGFVHFVERKDEMLFRGGQNIYPSEIERFLTAHPDISQAVVVGTIGRMGDTRLLAYILPRPGASLGAEQILDYCRGHIALYKVPDEIRFVEHLPISATGKVKRFMLREQLPKQSQ